MLDSNFLISYESVSFFFSFCVDLPFDWMGQCSTSQFKHYNHCGVAPFISNATFFVIQCINTSFSAVQMKRKSPAKRAKHQGLYLVTLVS